VRDALQAITETVIRFCERALAEGVSGIFYSIQVASASVMSEADYTRFGEPDDRRVLEALRGVSPITIVHAHGDRLMWDRLAGLPAHAWSWDDRATAPSLREAKARLPGAVVGGLDQWRTLRGGTPEEATAEVRDAIAQTDGVGLIVAPGCVLPMGTPDANVAAVVQALGGPLKKIPGVTS
jgi:uroporphyrinogen decarboxylase